ncbi:MAG: hypothetical protein LBU43_06580, partial [Candidatus Accumulibacter sp.]|nr:hypothetical protein [Accumulibacter sp.]
AFSPQYIVLHGLSNHRIWYERWVAKGAGNTSILFATITIKIDRNHEASFENCYLFRHNGIGAGNFRGAWRPVCRPDAKGSFHRESYLPVE